MSDKSQAIDFIHKVRSQVGKVVIGQDEVVERVLIALFTGGHLLLEGLPGLAKTLLVNTVAKAVDLQFSRVQFTIDMLPSDILGSEILDQAKGSFYVNKGPVFTNLLLADEINRAAPKVQGALLECMQERKVTIGKETFTLPSPFVVIATQNPVEQSGTFELPEAQLDRFMMMHRLGYPDEQDEFKILTQQLGLGLSKNEEGGAVPQSAFDLIEDKSVGGLADLVGVMEMIQAVHVSDIFTQHCLQLVRKTRENPLIEMGASPRAGLALVQAARARAFIHGRDYVVPEDLFVLAEDIILHRIRLTYEALAEGHSAKEVLQESLNQLG
ncbi:MoxR family ATPase [Lentisphaera profundi]|uniref:MoxR family ATPase n=1 Tax=Lentisphaera profundi TaxID=1658616 RepID=A0ABY7VT97_9BACT|nr:MoxR family ATPase [Lentisphaera profundi]WDE96445.1 MoxR family ATPase [Lentisphaera profundi]